VIFVIPVPQQTTGTLLGVQY